MQQPTEQPLVILDVVKLRTANSRAIWSLFYLPAYASSKALTSVNARDEFPTETRSRAGWAILERFGPTNKPIMQYTGMAPNGFSSTFPKNAANNVAEYAASPKADPVTLYNRHNIDMQETCSAKNMETPSQPAH